MNETKKQWYLPNDNELQANGPYSTEQVLEFLRSDRIKPDDFIFTEDTRPGGWQRIFQFEEFNAALSKRPVCPVPPVLSKGSAQVDKVEFNFERSGGEYGSANLYRRFPRAPASFPCFAHDQNQLIRGQISNISETGVLVAFDDPKFFKPGDELTLTVRAPEPIGTFSVRGVVMRILLKNPLEIIGINYLLLSPSVRRRIGRYVLQELTRLTHDQAAG